MLTYIVGFIAFLTLYTEINFFLIKRRSKGPVQVVKGAEPFFHRKGKVGALLIHGFTSSPAEFKYLAKYLVKKNVTVFAPLLPGHGTAPERLSIVKYYQWIETIEESLGLLAKDCDEIYLVGNSLGGNLAFIVAEGKRKVKGIISLGTPIYFQNQRMARAILPFMKRIKLFQKKKLKNYSKERVQELNKVRVAYNAVPLRSLSDVWKTVKLSKKKIKKTKQPIIVMETENDVVVSAKSGEYIMNNVQSKKKWRKILPESYHVFIIDKHKEKACKDIETFMRDVGKRKKW